MKKVENLGSHEMKKSENNKSTEKTNDDAKDNRKQKSDEMPKQNQEPPKSKYLSKPKLLYLRDSIGKNIDTRRVEMSTQSRIITSSAYASVKNTVSRFKDSNFFDVANKMLANPIDGKPYDALVLSAPTVDITNMNTAKLTPSDTTEAFKQQVVISCKNMMTVAENALKSYPSLRKVVIMEHTPRFDSPDVDPLGIKPILAIMANNIFQQRWLDSPLKGRIFIGIHNLNCSIQLREARYTNAKTGKFDGIHMYGEDGKEATTNSIIEILKQALPSWSSKMDVSQDFHSNCPQTEYQKMNNKKSYAQATAFHPSVKPQNRFSGLSGHGRNSGN